MIKGIRPSLAQAGAIKIGKLSDNERTAKSGRKWRPPVKLDHFLVTHTTRGADGNLEIDDAMMTVLKESYADSDGEVRSIPILLHSSVIDSVFPTTYAAYAGKSLVCRGDGETATRWRYKDKVRTGETFNQACPCEWLQRDERGAQRCKPHGVLHCTIALPGHAVAGAVYRYRTAGIISVQRVIGSLEQILSFVGTLENIPLVLRVQPVQVSPDGRPQTVYAVHVELREDVCQAQRIAIEARDARARLGGAGSISGLLQAPASDDEPPEEQAEVEAEFYPPQDETPEPDPPGRTEAVKRAAKKTAKKQKKEEEQMKPCAGCGEMCPDTATVCHACGGPTDPPHDDSEPDYGDPD